MTGTIIREGMSHANKIPGNLRKLQEKTYKKRNPIKKKNKKDTHSRPARSGNQDFVLIIFLGTFQLRRGWAEKVQGDQTRIKEWCHCGRLKGVRRDLVKFRILHRTRTSVG